MQDLKLSVFRFLEKNSTVISAVFLGSIIFAIDISLPFGATGAMLYIGLALLGIWFPKSVQVLWLFVACVFLVVAGYLISLPAVGFYSQEALHRGGVVLIVSIISVLIAKQKKLETERTNSQSMLDSALGQLFDGVALFDSEDRFVYANQVYRNQLPDDLLELSPGQKFEDIIRAFADNNFDQNQQREKQAYIDTSLNHHRELRKTPHRFSTRNGEEFEVRRFRTRDGGTALVRTDVTVRSDRADEIFEFQEMQRSVFESSPAGIVLTKPDGVIVQANPAWARCIGYSVDELSGMRVAELTHPDDLDESMKLLADLVEGRSQSFQTEKRYISKSGETIYGLVNCGVVKNSAGAVRWFIAHIEDIGEQKKSEEILRKSEERLSNAQHVAKFGHWERDLETNQLWWSDTMYEIFNAKKDDFVPSVETVMGFIDESQQAGIRELVAKCEATGESYDSEFTINLGDGTQRVVKQSSAAVRDANGKIIYLHGICRNFTQQRELELAHLAEMSKVQTLMANSIDGFITIDENGIVEAVNAAAKKIFDYDQIEIIGQNIDRLVLTGEAGEGTQIASMIGRGREITGFKKDGTEFPVFCSVIKIEPAVWEVGERRKPVRTGPMIVTVQDLSSRKFTEEALRQSQKMEAIGLLTGGIAHDFNNFLGIIVSSLDLVSDDIKGNVEAIDSLRTAQRAADRGSILVERLLRFSQRKGASQVVVNANQVINDMIDLLEQSLTQEVRIQTKLDSDLWGTAIDPSEFEESLLNLAINARDAIVGAGRLTIETKNCHLDQPLSGFRPDFKPGNFVEISVSDSGSGINPSDLNTVFEPFFTTKQDGQGTGLGLSMVYGFVRRSGGQITVESKPGAGTTFRLYLPQQDFVENQQPAKNGNNYLPQGDETVLVVDDVEDMARMASAILTKLGYKVTTTSDPKEAIEIIKKEGDRYHLLFTDLVMPDINGFELVEYAQTQCDDMKFLITSGYSEEFHLESDTAKDFGEILPKPYRRVDLAWRVRDILDQTSLN